MRSTNKIHLLEKDLLSSKEEVTQMMDFDSLWSDYEKKKEVSPDSNYSLLDTFNASTLRRTLFVFSAF